MSLRLSLVATSIATALALAGLTGCSGSATPAATGAAATATPPATASTAAAPAQGPTAFTGSPADEAAFNQAFSPLGDCQLSKRFMAHRHTIEAESVTMNAGNNGFCTFGIHIATGDIPSETITAPPQHGTVKFLPLTGEIRVGYRANAGYVGPDQFAISFVRADGIAYPITTDVTVANPATK
jgi:hypothetical protein